MPSPDVVGGIFAFVFGAIIGSFLNVVIWRLPRGESLSHPASHCPHCDRPLAAYENIPLLSFLVLRARCRTCGKPIRWRYFWVELLTAGLFLSLFLNFRTAADTVAYCLFFAALVAAFFIDLELFIIPDELNTFALLVGFARDIWGAANHEPAHALLWGWMPRSLLGAVLCAAVFVFIQLLGRLLFRKDAMGDGDVNLARAIGALLPLSQALVSFLLAIAIGAVVGIAVIAWQAARGGGASADAVETSEPDDASGPDDTAGPEATPLDEMLLYGLVYLGFVDELARLAAALRVPGAAKALEKLGLVPLPLEEDDFTAGPTHIPFGPFMVLGALLAVFVGDRLLQSYLRWAGLG